MISKVRKVNVLQSVGATPHGHVASVRFGAEMCAEKTREFATSVSGLLVIVEGRATLFGPQAIDERILQQKRENTQNFAEKM